MQDEVILDFPYDSFVGRCNPRSEFPQQMTGWVMGEQAVHVSDTRKYVIRSEQEQQLSRQCLDMSTEILHIPKAVPGVQAAKADAASSGKEANPLRNASFLIQRHWWTG